MQVDELKQKHPGVEIFEISAPEFPEPMYFRRPGRVEVERLRTELGDKNPRAGRNFIFGCLLSPDIPSMERILAEFPAVDTTIMDELYLVAGGKIKAETKKV